LNKQFLGRLSFDKIPIFYRNRKQKTTSKNHVNWYDYGARFYDAALGRWYSPDPLAELDHSMTPFKYCFNSPINYIDPLGLWEPTVGGYTTSDAEDIDRFISYMYAETSALNNNPSIDQMNTFISGEMSDQGSGSLSDGSKLAPTITEQGYKTGGGVNWYVDEKSVDKTWLAIQRDLTPYDLNPRTLNKNWIGSYPGPINPKMYCGKDDYSYFPTNLAEIPAYYHDLTYDKLGIKGSGGLLFDTRAIHADWQFVSQELWLSMNGPNIGTRFHGSILGIGLALGATTKTIMYYVAKSFNNAYPAKPAITF
jgi:RHS repeat-associated protein